MQQIEKHWSSSDTKNGDLFSAICQWVPAFEVQKKKADPYFTTPFSAALETEDLVYNALGSLIMADSLSPINDFKTILRAYASGKVDKLLHIARESSSANSESTSVNSNNKLVQIFQAIE